VNSGQMQSEPSFTPLLAAVPTLLAAVPTLLAAVRAGARWTSQFAKGLTVKEYWCPGPLCRWQ
jgi:hypothetical protein